MRAVWMIGSDGIRELTRGIRSSFMPAVKVNILSLNPEALQEQMRVWGEAVYRADQIQRWIWHDRVWDFSQMSNLSKALRENLIANYEIRFPKVVVKQHSEDGTIKYLLQLEDGRTVESVWIPRPDQGRVTVCISTQVGCRMGCTFCLTAQQKVERQLMAFEIASQLLLLDGFEDITNVVVMGMGEPFDNYSPLMEALGLITDAQRIGIGPKRVTVSTSGLVPAIYRFVKESRCRLAISLNASNNEVRSQLMPINRAYPIEKLLDCVREVSRPDYAKPNARDFYVTFEYILIRNLNDREVHAKELVRLLRGISCKVNLLLYNENPNIPYQRPLPEDVEKFQKILIDAGILNFIRKSRGRDISAACGQLASESKRQQIQSSPPTALL